MHNYREPTPPTPSTTNKEKSIIPLKQLKKNKLTKHSSTYLSYGTKSKVYHKNINQPANSVRPILFQYYHFRKHNEVAIEWLGGKKVYITVLFILRVYFQCIYRKEYTCKRMCIHFFYLCQKDWKEAAFFQKFQSHISAWVDRNEMDFWSMQRVKAGLSQLPPCAFEAKSMKVAAEKLRTAISVTVWSQLWLSGLQCPSFTSYSETPKTYVSPNLL